MQFESGGQVVFKVFQWNYPFRLEDRRDSHRSDLPCTIFFKHKACLHPYPNFHLKVVSGFHLNQNIESASSFFIHFPPNLNLWCISLGDPKQLFHFFLDRAKLVKKIWLLVSVVEMFMGQEIWTQSLFLLDISLEYKSVCSPAMDAVLRQTSRWDVSCYQDSIHGFLKHYVIAEIARHNALMKQQFSVICSFSFLAIYFYWNRQGNICYLYVFFRISYLYVY